MLGVKCGRDARIPNALSSCQHTMKGDGCTKSTRMAEMILRKEGMLESRPREIPIIIL